LNRIQNQYRDKENNEQYAQEIISAMKENEKTKEIEKEKEETFFGKVGNFFGKAKNQLEGKVKEINFTEKAKIIANKTKEVAQSTKEFVNDKSKDIMVIIF